MFEGTRHERAALVVIAYVIGFITAFIAYGLSQKPHSNDVSSVPAWSTPRTVSLSNQASVAHVAFEQDGLYAVTSEADRILTADKKAFTEDALARIQEGRGYHYRVIDAETSRNGKFVYFCEQLSAENSDCDPYVYVFETDVLHSVRHNNVRVTYPVANHSSYWTDGSYLVIGQAISADPTRPWELIDGQLQ
jgi:hypothetical protein